MLYFGSNLQPVYDQDKVKIKLVVRFPQILHLFVSAPKNKKLFFNGNFLACTREAFVLFLLQSTNISY